MNFINVKVEHPYSSTNTSHSLEKFPFYLITDIRFPSNWPVNSSPCFSNAYVNITFIRQDIDAKLYELIDKFQK